MNIKTNIQTKIYQILSTKFGKVALNLTKPFVRVANLQKNKGQTKPFYIAITVDTEAGYVSNEERRIWQFEEPESFQGVIYGLKNLREMADKNRIRMTFLLNTHCFSADRDTKKQIGNELKRSMQNHEIGLHLHPSLDASLEKALGKKLRYNSAKFYTKKEKLEMLQAAKKMLYDELKVNATSFRWGVWGLDKKSFEQVYQAGLRVDSSVTPGIKGHLKDDKYYNWEDYESHSSWKEGNLLELPIATFSYFGMTLRADPVYMGLLNKAFDVYHKNTDRSTKPFVFVVITHSSEATDKLGNKTRNLAFLEEFIKYAKSHKNVRFVTLKEAANGQ